MHEAKKKRLNSFYFLAYVLLAAMIINAIFLSQKYMNFYYWGDLTSSFECVDDCDSVMMSKYSLVYGIPVPIFGLSYFVVLGLLFWTKFRQMLLDFWLVIGCLSALSFIYLLYFELKLFCKFCMLSHVSLFAFAVIYFFFLRSDFKSDSISS